MSRLSPRQKVIRRIVVATVGFTLLIAGVLMLILPGPGLVVILAGLTVLATEFHWARRVKRRVIVWVRKRTKRKQAKETTSAKLQPEISEHKST